MAPPTKRPDAIDWAAVRDAKQNATRATDPTLAWPLERAQPALQEDAPARAITVDHERAAERGIEVVTFHLSGKRYAIEVRYVCEIAALDDFTPVPCAAEHLVGIHNFRGQLLPIFDLSKSLGLGQDCLADVSHILVCGESQPDLCLLVQEVPQIEFLSVSATMGQAIAAYGSSQSWIRGTTEADVLLLDGSALLTDKLLFVA